VLAASLNVYAGHGGGLPLAGVLGLAGHHASGNGTLFLVGAVLVLIGWWLRHVYVHPWGPHWLCKGTGRNGGSSRKSWGRCRSKRCRNGEVLRPSARLMYGLMGREAK
jgi:hypothetical protein